MDPDTGYIILFCSLKNNRNNKLTFLCFNIKMIFFLSISVTMTSLFEGSALIKFTLKGEEGCIVNYPPCKFIFTIHFHPSALCNYLNLMKKSTS